MERCKDCKHWSAPEHKWEGSIWAELGTCGAAPEIWRHTSYDREKAVETAPAHIKAFVRDGSDYMAKLLTRPDFGCTQFEPM